MAELDFAIIGAQKAASTTIQYYLNAHPNVELPLGEFAVFESPDFEQGRVLKDLDDRFVHGNKLVGLKRPNILGDMRAISRLFEHSPSCKVVVILREPIERFVSAYFHTMNSGKLPVKNINKAIQEMFYGKYLDKYPAGISLLHYGLYSDSLDFIESIADSSRIFLTSQHALKNDSEAELQKLSKFLNIPYVSWSASKNRKNRGSYDYRKAIFLNAGNRIRYSFNAGKTRKEYRNSKVLWLLGSLVTRIGNLPICSRPVSANNVLNDQSKSLLREYYNTDRQKLIKKYTEHVYW